MAYSVPALTKLLAEIDARAPGRSTASDGWIGDPAHASRHSDHNPEPDGSVDARDFTHDPAAGADMNVISEQIKDDPRLEGGGYIIWNWRIWNPDIARIWRPYTGTNGHTQHMHVSVSDEGQNDTQPWLEQEGLTVAEVEAILTAVRNQGQKTRQLIRAIAENEAERDRRLTAKEIQVLSERIEAAGGD